MTAKELISVLEVTEYAPCSSMEQTIRGCYIGDLLSRVMSRAKEGGVWITIMNNINVAAVALMAGVNFVVLAEGVLPDEALCRKCREEGVGLYQSHLDAFDLACRLKGLV